MSTKGFYKLQETTLLYGSIAVYNKYYTLIANNHETYTYPVDGWYYFESEELAREFFGLPAPIAPEPE
jgi:hypothetical protein